MYNTDTGDIMKMSFSGTRHLLDIIESHEFGQIRMLRDGERVLFAASDIAVALGYANPRDAIRRHCRCVVKRDAPHPQAANKIIQLSFITEGDVYRLIVHSKLPSAERFEQWVFDEVIPTIRKHGAYMTDSVLEQVLERPETIYTLAEQLLAEKGKNEEMSKRLDIAQPKADYFDSFVNPMDCTCIRYCGKEFGIPQNTFVAIMMEHHYLYRDQNGWLMPFSDKEAKGYFIVRDCYARNGKLVQQTRMTCKGKNHISKMLKRWGLAA